MSLLDRLTAPFHLGDSAAEGPGEPVLTADGRPPAVLFVDPEPNVLEAHRRTLRSLRPGWPVHFAADGPTGLTVLARNPVDVVVTELNLLVKDGDTFLAAVQKLFPQVVRIILSSECDAESDSIVRATQTAHQFLVKPCKTELLLDRIEHAVGLRRLLKNPELVRVIGGMPNLPSLPPLYFELLAAISSPHSHLSQVGDIIARDVSMTSRVMHLVSSAFFGLPRRVTTPQEAAVMLGVNTLKLLVLYARLFFTAPDSPIPGLTLDALWEHSSRTAHLAQEIVRLEGGDRLALEEALLAGMLHDIGKLLILEEKPYLAAVTQRMAGGLSFAEAEYREHSTSHAEIGAYLLGLWGLPDLLVEAVACHHRPGQLPRSGFSTVTAVHVANAILHGGPIPSSPDGNWPPLLDRSHLQRIGLAGRLPAWIEMARGLA